MDSYYEKVAIHHDFPAMMFYFNEETMKDVQTKDWIPPHWHRSIELSYVKKGNITLCINHQEKVIHAGEFICVNSGMIHELKHNSNSTCEVMMVILSYSFFKKVCKEFDQHLFHINKENEAFDRLVAIYEDLITLYVKKEPYYTLQINAKIYEIVYLLMRYFIDDEISNEVDNFKLQRHFILDYIEEHYQENLSLKNLASISHMSEEHFSHSFQKIFGINFKKYLTEYRLFQSYNDVVYSNLTIQSIALRHGFSNTKSFITEFKKVYKITPHQYRKLYQKKTK